jgi:hypothetical protein
MVPSGAGAGRGGEHANHVSVNRVTTQPLRFNSIGEVLAWFDKASAELKSDSLATLRAEAERRIRAVYGKWQEELAHPKLRPSER